MVCRLLALSSLLAVLVAACAREPAATPAPHPSAAPPPTPVPRPASWDRAAEAPAPAPVRRVRALVEALPASQADLGAATVELYDAASRDPDDRAVGEALARAVIAVVSWNVQDAALPTRDELLAAARRADERTDLPLLRGSLDTVEAYLLADLPPAARLVRARRLIAGIEARPLPLRNPRSESEALLTYVDTCAELWRFDEAWRAIDAMERLCATFPFPADRPYRAPETRANLHRCRFRLLLRHGIVDRAAAALQAEDEALRTARAQGGAVTGEALVADRIAFYLGTEQFEAAVRAVDAAHAGVAGADADPLLLLAKGIALAELGRHDEAEATLAAAQTTGDGLGAADWAKAQGQRIASALAVGDVDRADRLERGARGLLAGFESLDHKAMLGDLRLRIRERQDAGANELATCRSELQEVYAELLAALDASEPRPGGLGFLHFDEWSEVAVDLVGLALRLDGDAGGEHALDVVLAAQARSTLARRLGAGPLPWRELRTSLPGGTGVLVLLPGQRQSFVLAADAEGPVTSASLPPRAELDAGVALLRRLQDQPPTGTAPAELATLAQAWLPEPIVRRLAGWRGVVVAGAGVLEDVALEVLPLADGRLLGEALAVANLPALPLLPLLAQRPRATFERVCLFAHLAPSPQAQALLGTEVLAAEVPDTDIDQLLAPFAAGRCDVVRGSRATPAAWRERDLSPYGIVHVLAHGVYDPFRERGAGLALAPAEVEDGGILTCELVEANRSLRGVVVLSACGAARGPRRRGEGSLANLGGAALFAGAPAVVLARGDLRYRDTVVLMAELHRQLAAGGVDVAEAMRRARVATPQARWMAAQVQVFGAGF